MKRAIIYARVSTDEQAEKGYSLPTQLEAMRNYAKENGMKVMRELQDDFSGAKLDRPALDILRGMIEHQEADAVIVYAADRLSRNLAHLLILREEFARAGVELHYTNRGKSEDTAESRLMENIEGVIAEFEREKIKERMRRGKIGKVKAGKWAGYGRAPYPFRQVGKGAEARLEIDEAHAAIVRRIVDMLLGRNGYARTGYISIAKQLTAEGVPTATHARGWRTGVIYQLLRGRQLLGEFTRMGQTLEFPELAIIDRETWNEIQTVMERNRTLRSRKRKFPYLFSSFLKCTCGGGMCGRHLGLGNIPRYRYYHYVCQRHTAQRHLVDCKERSINVEILEPLVWNWIVALLTDDTMLDKGIRKYLETRESELSKTRERRATTEELIRRKEKQIERLTADLRELESTSARAAIKNELNTIGNERDALQGTLRELDAVIDAREIKDADIETIRAAARQIRAKLQGNLTYEQKRALFASIDLNIQLRHNETHEKERELFVTCGLATEGESLPLRRRLNSTAASSFYGGSFQSSKS